MELTHRPSTRDRGVTLFELLVASTISMVVLLALGSVDVSRIYLTNDIQRTVLLQSEAPTAIVQMGKELLQADRINLIATDPGNVQFRIPPADPAQLDDGTSYTWSQYRLDSSAREILFFEDITNTGCTVDLRFQEIDGLTLEFQDTAAAPPGGDPSGTNLTPPQDNNVLKMEAEWINTQGTAATTDDVTYTYPNVVTLRAGAYTDVATGLSPSTPSDPPGGC
jgi:hypothetical protein